jgi:proteasome lid subunit RPN8/RPN11
VIRLSSADWQRIAEAARRAYPEECCGLLVGTVDETDGRAAARVTRVLATENVATPSRRDRFEIDPRQQFALLRALRGTGEAIIGHYHSHPDAEVAPSAVDRDRIFDPRLFWLVVAVSPPRISGAAWLPDAAATTFVPVPLVIEP